MEKEFLNVRDQQALYEIKDHLSKIAVASTVMEASEDLPVNILLAITSEQVSVNVMYLPLPEDHFQEIRLMQLYSLLINEVDAALKPDLLVLVNALNEQSPFGNFFINADEELAFRYTIPLARFEIPKEVAFLEIFNLYLNILTKFRGLFLNVNQGVLPLSDALAGISSKS